MEESVEYWNEIHEKVEIEAKSLDPEIGQILEKALDGNQDFAFHAAPWFTCCWK